MTHATEAPEGQAPHGAALDDVITALMQTLRVLKSAVLGTPVEGACLTVLHTIGGHGSMRPGDLAAAVRLDASTVSRHLQVLERLDLVVRDRDPADGRAFRVEVTGSGRAALAEAAAVRRALLSDAIQGWSADDVAALADLLTRLAVDLDERADLAFIPPARNLPGTSS